MTATAIVVMVVTMCTVTAFTGYFFLKVLRPPKPGGADSRGKTEG